MAGEAAPPDTAALPAPTSEPLPKGSVKGSQKAAVLMAALGSERAANVLQRLHEDEIETLSVEMAQLKSVGAEATESVFTELAALSAEATGTSGGLEYAREVIERALGPERALELLGPLSGPAESRPFEFLRSVAPERIAGLLRAESPQTIALVLASLRTGQAAGVLARLPDAQQPDIALRIVRMGQLSTTVIERVEDALRHRMMGVDEREYATTGGAKALAEILNHAERSVERNVLENLAEADKGLADEVRELLFVFEDIVKLDERAVQQLLREVDQKDLVLALRGAPEEVKEVVLSNMSERGAAMLKEEMEIQQPQRKRDVDAAQSRIVSVVRKLEEAGTIVIASDSEEDGEAVV